MIEPKGIEHNGGHSGVLFNILQCEVPTTLDREELTVGFQLQPLGLEIPLQFTVNPTLIELKRAKTQRDWSHRTHSGFPAIDILCK